MNTHTAHLDRPSDQDAPSGDVRRKPGPVRRGVLLLVSLPALAAPVVWGGASVAALVSGADAAHTFHAVTGQGLVLAGLWLTGVLPLLRAGWNGVAPAPATALHHPLFVLAALVCGLLAPTNGGLAVAVVLTVSLALTWLALPVRPRPSRPTGGLDLWVTPLALATAAWHTPYLLDQAEKQRAMADQLSTQSHYFDNAWLMVAATFLVAASVVVGQARLLLVAGATQVVTGGAALLWTDRGAWGWVVLGLGAAAVAAGLHRRAVRPSEERRAD